MSQVVRAITDHELGDRKIIKDSFSPLFQDVFNIKSSIQDTTHASEIAKAYRISVTLGSQVWVTESEALTNEGALQEAISRTKKQIIESIFGEFRTDLMMIERALYDRDFQQARNYLRVLEVKMFSVE
jgi:hypothetical protein